MKRGRDTVSEEMKSLPVKKKDLIYNAYGKQAFWLVLPFIFPGFYGDDNELAFRTWLGLAGTCRRLRYWEMLRRWIAYVCPTKERDRIIPHGFPLRLLLSELKGYYEKAVMPLTTSRHFENCSFVCFSAYLLDFHNNRQFEEKAPLTIQDNQPPKLSSNFCCTVADVPFFNCITVFAGVDKKRVLVYLAPSFAEMVLFCYACMADRTENNVDQWYCCVPMWKKKPGDDILFSRAKRETFLKKSLLGKLRRIGNTAPLDYGFTHGSLNRTAFSHFMGICDTSGSKVHTTPHDRLISFVKQWFKQDVFARTEPEKGIYALHEDEPFFY